MEWWQWIILIFAGAVAIRVSLKFDLNQFLKERRKIKITRLQNICPHCKIEFNKDNKQIKCTPYFYSPEGTLDQVCSRCKCIVPFEENVKRICENYAKDPKRWLEQENKFIKQMKKLKLA